MSQKVSTYVIEPKSSWHDFHLKEVWSYRDLIALFVKRSFVSQYKQTVLGPAWAIIQPLLTTVVFTIVFGNFAKLSTDNMPPFLFYMCGNVVWGYFSTCLVQTSSTFIANAPILGKVYFPRLVMPISTVLEKLITFSIQLVFFIIFLLVFIFNPEYTITPNIWILTTPFLIVEMAMLALGFGIIISALTTKYRDLAMLVSFGVQLWMYACPVVYAASTIPEKYAKFYFLNPMAPIIEVFRYAFLGSGSVHVKHLIISFFTTTVVLFVGVLLFNRVERTFMDTV